MITTVTEANEYTETNDTNTELVASPNTMSKNLEKLTKKFTDVKFLVGINKKCVCGVKSILAANSTVFERMLFNGMKETFLDEIELPTYEYKSFESMIKFLISGRVDRHLFLTDQKFVLKVADLARCFDIPELLRFTEESFYKNLTLKNFADNYYLAEEYNFEDFKLKTLLFISKNALEFLNSEVFINLNKLKFVEEILNFIKDDVFAEDILNAIVKWINLNKGTNYYKKSKLTNLIQSLNFDEISNKELLILDKLGPLGASILNQTLRHRILYPVNPLNFRISELTWCEENSDIISSNSNQIFECRLANESLEFGTLTWEIEVIEACNGYWAGCAYSDIPKTTEVHLPQGAFVWGKHGQKMALLTLVADRIFLGVLSGSTNKRLPDYLKYDKGDVLKFILELGHQVEGRILKVCKKPAAGAKNQNEMFEIPFADLPLNRRFHPVIIFRNPGSAKIKLISHHKILR